jgi:putative aldouronate transport system permease protein
MVLLSVGRIFYADFGLFYQVPMNSGMIYPTTNVIDTYVYRALLQVGDIGMSSAAGAYQSLVGFVVVMLANLAVKKADPDNALF